MLLNLDEQSVNAEIALATEVAEMSLCAANVQPVIS
jgi:hypothetical protein